MKHLPLGTKLVHYKTQRYFVAPSGAVYYEYIRRGCAVMRRLPDNSQRRSLVLLRQG